MGKLERIFFHRSGNIKGFVDRLLPYMSAILLLATLLLNILWAFRNSDAKDFGSFYASGRAYLSGDNPYSSELKDIFIVELDGNKISSPNLNPPFSIYFASLITLLPVQTVYYVWQIFSILVYILCIFILYKVFPVNKLKILWALNLAGFWHTIELGQIYIPLLLLMTISWYFLDKKKYIVAGVFIGLLIAIKPNFAIWVLVMVVGGFWKISISAVTTVVVVSLLPLITNGLKIYQQWISASSVYNGYGFPGNGSLFGLALNLGNFNLGYLLALTLIALGVYVINRYKPDKKSIHLIGLTLSLLCSPIAWAGYTILLIPGLFTIKWKVIHKVAAAFLSVPVLILYSITNEWPTFRVVFSWIYGFAILLLFCGTVYEIMKGQGLSDSSKPPIDITTAEIGDI